MNHEHAPGHDREFGPGFDDYPMFPGFPNMFPQQEDEPWPPHVHGPGFPRPEVEEVTPEVTPSVEEDHTGEMDDRFNPEFMEQFKWTSFSFLNGMDRYTFNSATKNLVNFLQVLYRRIYREFYSNVFFDAAALFAEKVVHIVTEVRTCRNTCISTTVYMY